MAKKLKILTAIFCLLLIAFCTAYFLFKEGVFLSLAITAGTFFYHYTINNVNIKTDIIYNTIEKLIHNPEEIKKFINNLIEIANRNNIDYNKPWYKQRKFEIKLYQILKVKKWKKFMPTYAPANFSVKEKTVEQIIMASCQAELVHTVIVVLSFLPIVFSLFFNSFWVFFITSVFSALFDLCFVVIQRYNRPRLLKLKK